MERSMRNPLARISPLQWKRRWRTAALASLLCLSCAGGVALAQSSAVTAAIKTIPISLKPSDVLPTGNEWISLPDIQASDGALNTFNVLSMHYRGLLQVTGGGGVLDITGGRGEQGATREGGTPVIQPFFDVDGKSLAFENPSWSLIEYWIPTAHLEKDGIEMTLTWCAPEHSRGAFLRLTMTNHRAVPVKINIGVQASFGALDRVTYNPVELHGQRIEMAAPWMNSGETFAYVTNDTKFSWTLLHPDSTSLVAPPPLALSPTIVTKHKMTLRPGATAQTLYVLGAGVEEFSSSHNARALEERLDREGADAVIANAAAWCQRHTRTTGNPALDMVMNRNFLFTAMYAWGRTIDTEQFVGVTSRSPRYYVSAAYWDRDAMLWSFPALLDIDHNLARRALKYALTIQLRNTGTHSRFIDGIVLEDGFELDEAAAPVVALTEYVDKTNDLAFLQAHRHALNFLRDRLLSRYDASTGLYSTLQDAQDEYEKVPFVTYDNVLVWKAFLDMSTLFDNLHDPADAQAMTSRAAALRKAIMTYCVASGAPGADGPIFVSATDGKKQHVFVDIPPGSLMKLPILGFISQDNPLFVRTYNWLHSKNYNYSYAGDPYGLPGSYRLPFTTSWSVADHFQLKRGHDEAMKILLASHWDGGIITEGIDPNTASAHKAGRAFATAAGYVASAICTVACEKQTQ